MLTRMAPGPDAQRVASDALVRLGRVMEAARQLEGSSDVADQTRRATMFFEARMWPDAAEAYADVLHNSSLPSANRAEATDRYALALALSGKAPTGDLGNMGGLARQVIGALPQDRNDNRATAVSALRNSLQRAGQIETMVSEPSKTPAPRAQAKSGG
jgi:predicted acyl esterase